MLRLCALTLAVATLAGVGALATPEDAQALSNPQSTLLRALSPSDLKALIQDIDAQGLQSGGSANTRTGVTRMQMAAGRIAPLKVAGSLGVVATGSLVVWQIADALGLGGYVYKTITGRDTYGGSLSATTMTWKSLCVTGGGCAGTGLHSGTGTTYPAGWAGGAGGNSTIDAGESPAVVWGLHGSFASYNYCLAATPCSGTAGYAQATAAALTVGVGTATNYLSTSTNTCGGGAAGCIYKLRTEAQMQAAVQLAPTTAGVYASPPAGATTVSAGTNDTTLPTDPELAAALDEIDPTPGTTGTPVEQETAEAILDELDPGWETGTAITLLQPEANETYTDYILRLQASGWVGTATSTVLATEAENIGPLAVARVTFPNGATVRTLSPLAWPTTAPMILPTAAITIRYNPSTAPPAPTEGTGTSVTVTIPPTTVPPGVDIDFSPITDLDGECSFPFGFICYAQEVTAEFDVTADAPVFDFDVTVPSLAGGGTIAYTVDLDVMDDYMALMRTLISFVLWVGAVYFLAVNLLGFRAGGDPAETADEALHV